MTSTSRSTPGIAFAALLLVATPVLTGCTSGQTTDDRDELAVVLSPTMGSSVPSAAALDEVLDALDREGDHLVAVVADGKPFVAVDVTVGELPGNSDDREDWLNDFRSKVRTALLEKTAVTPETDPAEAIALAAGSLREGGRHVLVVHGSGLATTGALSMLDGRLFAEPADLIANVGEAGIPDLSEVEVRMPDLGVVTDPQAQLTEAARGVVAGIWSAYFAAASASSVDLAPASTLATRPQQEGLPAVTPVPIDRPQPLPLAGCRLILGDATIGFEAGSSVLSDTSATRALIERAVADMAGCDGSYRVEGSASSEGDEADNVALTDGRSRSVADVIADVTGVPVTQMKLIGWGEKWPCRQPDTDADGQLILEAAIADRVVVVSKVGPGAELGC